MNESCKMIKTVEDLKSFIETLPNEASAVSHFFDANLDATYADCALQLDYDVDTNELMMYMSFGPTTV